jgi:transcriptional regulator GlxA family with amidase domain
MPLRALNMGPSLCLSEHAIMLEHSGTMAARLNLLPSGRLEVDPRVQSTIERMEEQLHRRLPVSELADAVGLSVAQLTRLFREELGVTPGAFLHELRMNRARILVETTSLPIVEIMGQVGISDRSHFARDFKRAHGLSPRTHRMHTRAS